MCCVTASCCLCCHPLLPNGVDQLHMGRCRLWVATSSHCFCWHCMAKLWSGRRKTLLRCENGCPCGAAAVQARATLLARMHACMHAHHTPLHLLTSCCCAVLRPRNRACPSAVNVPSVSTVSTAPINKFARPGNGNSRQLTLLQ
jgi:hypothetical protein